MYVPGLSETYFFQGSVNRELRSRGGQNDKYMKQPEVPASSACPRRYTRDRPNWPLRKAAYTRSPPRGGAGKTTRNRLNRKEGGLDSGGGTLRRGTTIYDGLAGTYLGRHLLSVVRERKRGRREREEEREG